MTDEPHPPLPDEATETSNFGAKPPPRDAVPWLYGLGFLILAAAIFYLWQYPTVPAETASNEASLRNLEQHLTDIDGRLTRLEQRPIPDLGKITARVDALESRSSDETQLASRLDTLSGRIESLAARDQTALDATKQRIDALTTRVAELEATAGNVASVSKKINEFARLQEASLALAAGKPIGDLPDAPPALARFAHSAPPTESALRLSFAHAEQAALAANQPNESDAPFVDRVWDRAQGLLTVRRGGNVVVGNPSATTLGHAQAMLEAGDLKGATEAVETLTGPPRLAMSDWLSQAKALLDARSALTSLAGQS